MPVNEVNNEDECEKIAVTLDSGTVDHVGPKHVAEAFEVKESDKSRRGFKYQVANDIEIPNEGEKWISGCGEDWQLVKIHHKGCAREEGAGVSRKDMRRGQQSGI